MFADGRSRMAEELPELESSLISCAIRSLIWALEGGLAPPGPAFPAAGAGAGAAGAGAAGAGAGAAGAGATAAGAGAAGRRALTALVVV